MATQKEAGKELIQNGEVVSPTPAALAVLNAGAALNHAMLRLQEAEIELRNARLEEKRARADMARATRLAGGFASL